MSKFLNNIMYGGIRFPQLSLDVGLSTSHFSEQDLLLTTMAAIQTPTKVLLC